MKKNTYLVIGVMSGTSLDGIDLALCKFILDESNQWKFEILQAETKAYPLGWTEKLHGAIDLSYESIQGLNRDYTRYIAEVIHEFITQSGIQYIDAICSHGHTVFHEPDKGFTLQIGNLPELATLLGNTVVCDFRVQDVLLGGQGAPLVPIGDQLLFGHYDACLNLGGFANISFQQGENRLAYDVCPVNIVLNYYAEKLGKPYDDGGTLASSGTVNDEVLEALNSLDYFAQFPPKSLGLEWVKQFVFPVLEKGHLPEIDVLRTYVEHVAIQISRALSGNKTVLITGGGAFNQFLMKRLESRMNTPLEIPNTPLVEYKEALVFGFLGILKLRDEVNCLASVTGARKDHSSGYIYSP